MEPDSLDTIAGRYVRLVLAMGLHDADSVDAYYGPAAWKEEVAAENPGLEQIRERAQELLDRVPDEPATTIRTAGGGEEALLRLRQHYLRRQLAALVARAGMRLGSRLTFDEQAEALYDAAPPSHTEAEFEAILHELEGLLPGDGALPGRLERFRSRFVIPPDRLDPVFRAAIDECRARTLEQFALPPG
ncbi:MAG TPA: hypothetical protein VGE86_12070, partial [Thermoanaerobaculia bacterium]